MKKLIFSAIMIAILFAGVSRGQGWVELTTGYASPWIVYDLSFPAGQDDVGYAALSRTTVGQEGAILKTIDGGDTWTTIWPTSGTIDGITSIFFTSTDVGYAGGFQASAGTSYFIKTTDGGVTWTPDNSFGDIYYFESIKFWDANNGIVTGGNNVWVTDNAGTSWTTATGVTLTANIFEVDYATEDIVFLVGGDEKMNKSTDGGLTWSEIYSGTFQFIFFGVDFADADYGVVGGEDGKVLTTTDGGGSWSTWATGYHNFYAVTTFVDDSAYVGGTDEDLYKTTNAGTTWDFDYNGTGSSTLYRVLFTDNNTGFMSGSSGKIWRKGAPLTADFTSDVTTVCTGGMVNFTDQSNNAYTYTWVFEGGTPATSTAQNPSVTYNTAGTYDVELTVYSVGGSSHTELKEDYISVIETPGQADAPSGDDEICTSGTYLYTTTEVTYGQSYDWEVDPADAGTLTMTMNEVILATSDTWTGDFTLKVRATNSCGDGAWSDNFSGTMAFGPDLFTLEGEGGYCMGTDGAEMTLSGSQTGIDYELYLGGVPTGIIEAGTGSALSFDPVTEAGFYTAVAISSFCSTTMTGQIAVFVLFPPSDPATPTGAETVCNTETTDYESTGSFEADSYEWTLSPAEAGTLTADELTATVEWSTDYSGTANITLVGINSCGAGDPSDALEVVVEGMPTPEVSGLDLVCDFDVTDYTTAENAGSTYTWEVTGGTITDGQGTYMVTVEWGEAGTGTVSVTEETATGCEGSSEEFSVMIDDCTDISETGLDNNVAVYPNPVNNVLNIEFNNEAGNEQQVIIYNHLGQEVYQSEKTAVIGKQKLELNIAHLSDGVYFVKVSSNNNVLVTKKVIKR